MSCRIHGVIVAAVPWARHQAGHTHFFDDQVAWLATQTSKTAITVLMRIAWRTVGAIITRVWADTEKLHDQFADLTRIGINHPTSLSPSPCSASEAINQYSPAGFNPRIRQESLKVRAFCANLLAVSLTRGWNNEVWKQVKRLIGDSC